MQIYFFKISKRGLKLPPERRPDRRRMGAQAGRPIRPGLPAMVVLQGAEEGIGIEPGGSASLELVETFGAQRRGVWISARVNEALEHLGLETFPDFEYEWIDGRISVRKVTRGTQSDVAAENEAEPTDPTYRIGKLEAANRPPASVAPEAPISRAVTLMMTHDYSQLPVMQGERTVKGILSWASLGQRLAFGQAANTAMDCAVSHHEISANTSLFNAIDGIVRHGYALIRGSENRITGIVPFSTWVR